MNTTTSFAQERPMFETYVSNVPRLLRQSAYLIVGFPLATAAFVSLITLFSFGVGTVIIWIGLPVLVVTLHTAGLFAAIERRSAATATGRQMPEPTYLPPTEGGPAILRPFGVLRDPSRWFELLWGMLHFIVSTLTFCITVTWWVGAAATVLGPLSVFVLARFDGLGSGLGSLLGFALGSTPGLMVEAALNFAVGLFFLLTLPFVINALANLQASASHSLLSLHSGYEQRIDDLRDSRSAARDAEAASLRRLERDIHDGPQQRLIRLQMDLARAERAAATDPERARTLLAEARSQAKDTLDELRSLSRNVAPPVLVDRGLDAALAELAARSDVPTTVGSETSELPDHVATAAYFVVAEAMANINKHSLASEARVSAIQSEGLLTVSIIDNGVGGASLAKGHGLAGLAERLRGVDGRLSIDSPDGGPTVVVAEIPCAS